MSGEDCIFCKIAAGDLPSRLVLETADCVGLLDVSPLAPGHCLVIPRRHVMTFAEMPPDVAGSMFGVLPELGRAVIGATGAQGFNVLVNNGVVAGQVIMHVHAHVIPRRVDDGLGYRWTPREMDDAAADSLRAKIIAELGG